MTNFQAGIIFTIFLAAIGLGNWWSRRVCKKCGKRICNEPDMIGLTHSIDQCKRDSCWCSSNSPSPHP